MILDAMTDFDAIARILGAARQTMSIRGLPRKNTECETVQGYGRMRGRIGMLMLYSKASERLRYDIVPKHPSTVRLNRKRPICGVNVGRLGSRD